MPRSCCCPCQVCFEIVGYLLEELRDETNFENFKNDVASANVFIGSLIFIEELADKVRRGPVTQVIMKWQGRLEHSRGWGVCGRA